MPFKYSLHTEEAGMPPSEEHDAPRAEVVAGWFGTGSYGIEATEEKVKTTGEPAVFKKPILGKRMRCDVLTITWVEPKKEENNG